MLIADRDVVMVRQFVIYKVIDLVHSPQSGVAGRTDVPKVHNQLLSTFDRPPSSGIAERVTSTRSRDS
jgi:hypothetical protein